MFFNATNMLVDRDFSTQQPPPATHPHPCPVKVSPSDKKNPYAFVEFIKCKMSCGKRNHWFFTNYHHKEKQLKFTE